MQEDRKSKGGCLDTSRNSRFNPVTQQHADSFLPLLLPMSLIRLVTHLSISEIFSF